MASHHYFLFKLCYNLQINFVLSTLIFNDLIYNFRDLILF